MGTRNLTVVVFGGVTRVAQYGQWDGYPSGQGATVLDFVRNKMNAKFFSNLLKTKFIIDKLVGTRYDTNPYKFESDHPQLTRNICAKVLEHVQMSTSNTIELANGITFAADSLFCEWAYVLDLDKNVLEVYRGFQEKSLNGVGRFAYLEDTKQKYKPIRLLKSYDLDRLPQKRDFIRELEKLTKD